MNKEPKETKTQNNTWREEAWKKICDLKIGYGGADESLYDYEAEIKKILTEERKKWLREEIKSLEGMKEEWFEDKKHTEEEVYKGGYNQAIQDLISKHQQELGKLSNNK